MMNDYSGQQIGSYRLIRRLGFGGFASVYLGQHVRISTQQAAIKLLHILDVDTKKFQQEAETTAALVHPHIIRLFDYDFHDQMPFLVMDYASGGSLRSRHPWGTQVPLATVVQYVQEIAKALEYAHSKHVIHRDIKPDNVLIGGQGELRLSDFGIAVLSGTGRTTLAASYDTGGTAYYMAPEQSRGKPEKASDQYALGIMVYEWFCGRPPFSEGNAINIQYQHAYEPVPPLREQLPSLSSAVEQVIMRALAKDPKGRFATVQEFATALEEACIPLRVVPASSLPAVQKKPNGQDFQRENKKKESFLLKLETGLPTVAKPALPKYGLLYAFVSGAIAGPLIDGALRFITHLLSDTFSQITLSFIIGFVICCTAGFVTGRMAVARKMGWITGIVGGIAMGVIESRISSYTPLVEDIGNTLIVLLFVVPFTFCGVWLATRNHPYYAR